MVEFVSQHKLYIINVSIVKMLFGALKNRIVDIYRKEFAASAG